MKVRELSIGSKIIKNCEKKDIHTIKAKNNFLIWNDGS